MASPQVENGYTMISTELLKAFARRGIKGECRRIIDAIILETYAWHKKEAVISIERFIEITGMKKRCIYRAISTLIKMNIVKKSSDKSGTKEKISYCLQKDYDLWNIVTKVALSDKSGTNQCQKWHKSGDKSGTLSIKILDKDIKDKDTLLSPISYGDDSEEIRLSKLLFSLIRERNPSHKPPNFQKWAREIDLMARREKRTYQEIEKVIRWCQANEFWQNNILSTKKLRKQFDQLVLKAGLKHGETEEEKIMREYDEFKRKEKEKKNGNRNI